MLVFNCIAGWVVGVKKANVYGYYNSYRVVQKAKAYLEVVDSFFYGNTTNRTGRVHMETNQNPIIVQDITLIFPSFRGIFDSLLLQKFDLENDYFFINGTFYKVLVINPYTNFLVNNYFKITLNKYLFSE